MREGARAVLLRRQRRFHWHEESETQRQRMLGQIAALDLDCRVYVSRPVAARHEDRARALCLNALLWDLWQSGINELVLERRQEHNNRRDERTILAAKVTKRAAPRLRYRFDRPEAEPVLWLADTLASATSAAIAHGASYLEPLGERLTRIDVDP